MRPDSTVIYVLCMLYYIWMSAKETRVTKQEVSSVIHLHITLHSQNSQDGGSWQIGCFCQVGEVQKFKLFFDTNQGKISEF